MYPLNIVSIYVAADSVTYLTRDNIVAILEVSFEATGRVPYNKDSPG